MALTIVAAIKVEAATAAHLHPNRIPFSGTLCQLDKPSTRPPNMANGMVKLIMVPTAVAAACLSTLLGMGVNMTTNLDGHDKTNKIGVITHAWIEPGELKVSGHLYGKDFPDEVKAVQAKQDKLGMSFELLAAYVDLAASVLVTEDIIFTGGAILQKDKAAYQMTSVAAASWQQNEEIDTMPLNEIKTLLTAQAASNTATSEAITAALATFTSVAASMATSAAATQKAVEDVTAGMPDFMKKKEDDKKKKTGADCEADEALAAANAKIAKLEADAAAATKLATDAAAQAEAEAKAKTEADAAAAKLLADKTDVTASTKESTNTWIDTMAKRDSLGGALVSKFKAGVGDDGTIGLSQLNEVFAACATDMGERLRMKNALRGAGKLDNDR